VVTLIGWVVLAGGANAPLVVWLTATITFALIVFSWLDDYRNGLPVAVRLVAHFVAAIAGVALLPAEAMVFQGLLPPLADRALAVIAWVWFINLFNFMDGIDGITGVETVTIGIGIAAVSLFAHIGPEIEASALAGAALGFLVWNWHPAKIFLGEVGSVPLGFLLGGLLITEATRGHWAAALILPAYYLADATITLGKRAIAGEKVWQAHKKHFYQIALRGGASHAAVVRWIAGSNIVLVALAVVSTRHPIPALVAAAVVVALLLAQLARMGRTPRP
jgi:UDP-N-acetylmuramyl pentapeptide phosphotransferase/UDP-N-acetylglucosamine-1-phosphate transferase